MTGTRCPVCRATEVLATATAASCTSCGHGWPVEQLALDVGDTDATVHRFEPDDRLGRLRTRSARSRWQATRDREVNP